MFCYKAHMGNFRSCTVDSVIFTTLQVHDLGMSDTRSHKTLGVSCLAFYFHMQALHFASIQAYRPSF